VRVRRREVVKNRVEVIVDPKRTQHGGTGVEVPVRVEVVAVVVIGVITVIEGQGRGTSDQGPVQATDHIHLVHPRKKVLITEVLEKGHHLQNVMNEDDEQKKRSFQDRQIINVQHMC